VNRKSAQVWGMAVMGGGAGGRRTREPLGCWLRISDRTRSSLANVVSSVMEYTSR
jgi:hypothetical protein